MRADPAQDTNALLLQLVTGGNSTIRSANDLPSATFTPSPGIVPVNVLFSLSLTLAICISFFAILGKQWLVHYRQRTGAGGTQRQRWDQLQRYLGAKRWDLEEVLNHTLPALLQLDLLLFSIALIIYLQTLSKIVCLVMATPFVIAVQITLRLTDFAVQDYWCPFYTIWPQITARSILEKNHSLWLIIAILYVVLSSPLLVIRVIIYSAQIISWRIRHYLGILRGDNSETMQDRDQYKMVTYEELAQPSILVAGKGFAKPDTPSPFLHAAAIQRVLCNSDDFNTLIYVAINIQALNEERGIQYFLENDTVHQRLGELVRSPNKMLASAFCCAFAYLLLRGRCAELFVTQEHRRLFHSGNSLSQTSQYPAGFNTLKKKVQFIRRQLEACEESPGICRETLVGMRHYYGLLECLLDETSTNQDLSGWLDRIMHKQQQKELSTPLALFLVANTVQILNEGVKSAEAHLDLRVGIAPDSQQVERNGEYQERLNVRRQRLEMFKILIRTKGWDSRLDSGSR